MNRRRAREYVLKLLFQFEFTGSRVDLFSPQDFWPQEKDAEELRGFAGALFRGTVEHIGEIDRVIQAAAEHWDLQRMAAVDRNIIRLAVYEVLFRKDIPPAATINEALEIAKKYSAPEAGPFINGLLDRVVKEAGRQGER
ncbi:MAG: transcription antitermination factor NusB [Nitrospiraceae bacterium]|nr:transcription antitermination factor NusB [Nitrospiraceae bacterium]